MKKYKTKYKKGRKKYKKGYNKKELRYMVARGGTRL